MDQKKHRKKKKQQHSKRIQVVDDQGWTHVTTSTTAFSKKSGPRRYVPIPAVDDRLVPAEIPDGFTLEKLRDRYEWHKNRWLTSEAWEAVRGVLEGEMAKSNVVEFDNCVCIGLGSLSGLLRGGLVDRRTVSLFQVAALAEILEYACTYDIYILSDRIDTACLPSVVFCCVTAPGLIRNNHELARSVSRVKIGRCFAQDPVFNSLDQEFLQSIGIEVVQTPEAFGMVNEKTFLYAPGAERTHLLDLLSKNPAAFFGGPLENGPMYGYSLPESYVERETNRLILVPKMTKTR